MMGFAMKRFFLSLCAVPWVAACVVPAAKPLPDGEAEPETDAPAEEDTDAPDPGDTPDPPDPPGVDSSISPPDSAADSGADTAPTPGGGGAFPLEYFTFSVVFGFDPASATARSVTLQGNVLGPQLELVVGSGAYFQGTAPAESCVLVFRSLTTWPTAAWTANVRALFVYESDPAAQMTTTCTGLIPPGRITALSNYVLTQSSWAGGVHPLPFDPAVAAAVAPLAGLVVPGGVTDPMNPGQYGPTWGFTYGYQVDGAFDLLLDAAGQLIPMQDYELLVGNQLQRGLYVVSSLYYFPALP
jgi:hypothetical protein